MSKTETLEDVHKLLAKIKDPYDVVDIYHNVSWVTFDGQYALIKLKTGALIFSSGGLLENVDGDHGDKYNTNALAATCLMLQAKLITDKQFDLFDKWWREVGMEYRRQRSESKLVEDAHRLGYTLTKIEDQSLDSEE